MATLGGDVIDLAQIAKRDDMYGRLADLLMQSNRACADGPIVKSNKDMSHVSSQIVGYPTVGYAQINGFTSSSRSTVQNVEDQIAMARGFSTIDTRLIDDIPSNGEAIRFGEGKTFINSMWNLVSESLFYGSIGDNPDEFNGLTTRPQYSTLGNNVLSGGGAASSNSSVWLIKWHPELVFLLAPRNGVGGLEHIDHGRQVFRDSTSMGGGFMTAYVDEWRWFIGLGLKDPRACVRIANVVAADVKALANAQEQTDYATNLTYLMAAAIHRLPPGPGNPVFYMNRSTFEGLDRQSLIREAGISAIGSNQNQGKAGNNGTTGGPVYTFRGIPIRIEESLTYVEATVS